MHVAFKHVQARSGTAPALPASTAHESQKIWSSVPFSSISNQCWLARCNVSLSLSRTSGDARFSMPSSQQHEGFRAPFELLIAPGPAHEEQYRFGQCSTLVAALPPPSQESIRGPKQLRRPAAHLMRQPRTSQGLIMRIRRSRHRCSSGSVLRACPGWGRPAQLPRSRATAAPPAGHNPMSASPKACMGRCLSQPVLASSRHSRAACWPGSHKFSQK